MCLSAVLRGGSVAAEVETGEVAARAADWFLERLLPPKMRLLERALSMFIHWIGLNHWMD